jgi:hypothetical protein
MTPPAMAPLLVDFFDIAANVDAEGSGDPDCALISVVRCRWLNGKEIELNQLMQIQSQERKMAYLGDPEAVPELIELAGCVTMIVPLTVV